MLPLRAFRSPLFATGSTENGQGPMAIGARASAPEHRSPEYLAKLLRSDIERWADRIKAAWPKRSLGWRRH
jgi:hypothetical protein